MSAHYGPADGQHRSSPAGKLRIEIQDRAGLGRGLVSLGNEPNEVLLSLPYDTVFMDTEVGPYISTHLALPVTESMTG